MLTDAILVVATNQTKTLESPRMLGIPTRFADAMTSSISLGIKSSRSPCLTLSLALGALHISLHEIQCFCIGRGQLVGINANVEKAS
jgi:hypothetical protein